MAPMRADRGRKKLEGMESQDGTNFQEKAVPRNNNNNNPIIVNIMTETNKIEQSYHTLVTRSCGLGYTCSQGLGIIVLCVGCCEKIWQLHLCILQPRVILFATYGLRLCLWKLWGGSYMLHFTPDFLLTW